MGWWDECGGLFSGNEIELLWNYCFLNNRHYKFFPIAFMRENVFRFSLVSNHQMTKQCYNARFLVLRALNLAGLRAGVLAGVSKENDVLSFWCLPLGNKGRPRDS